MSLGIALHHQIWEYFKRTEDDGSKAKCGECSKLLCLGSDKPMSISTVANSIDKDSNKHKIDTEFCHYLEKSKQLLTAFDQFSATGQI